MIRKYLHEIRRQMLLWQLHNHQGWLEELNYSEQAVRAAKQKRINEIAYVRMRLAKLDGERMLMGKADDTPSGAARSFSPRVNRKPER